MLKFLGGGYDVSNLNEYSGLPENLQGSLTSVTSPALTDNLVSLSEVNPGSAAARGSGGLNI